MVSRLHGSDTLELTAVYAKRQHEQPWCLGVMHLREVCRCVTPSKIVAENSGIAGFKLVAAKLGINCVTRFELWNRKEDPYFWATYHVRNRQGKHHRSYGCWKTCAGTAHAAHLLASRNFANFSICVNRQVTLW